MDRVDPLAGAARDGILGDPNATLYVPDAAASQVQPYGNQLARLNGTLPGVKAQIVRIGDGDLTGIDPNLASRTFDVQDMSIVQAANEMNLPVLTMDRAMVNEIASNPARAAIWGHVRIVVIP